MSLDSFDNLKLEIAAYLNRDDLAAKIDTFIQLAEERHRTELRVREMLKRATSNCSTTVRYLALPAGYLGMRVLRLMTTPVTRVQFVNEDEITRLIINASGIPQWYSVHEEIEFNRVCASAYSAEMIYYSRPTPLATGQQSNVILLNYPALYLYGSLVEAEPYLDNDERIMVWKQFYETGVENVTKSDMRSRHPGALRSRVIGATP